MLFSWLLLRLLVPLVEKLNMRIFRAFFLFFSRVWSFFFFSSWIPIHMDVTGSFLFSGPSIGSNSRDTSWKKSSKTRGKEYVRRRRASQSRLLLLLHWEEGIISNRQNKERERATKGTNVLLMAEKSVTEFGLIHTFVWLLPTRVLWPHPLIFLPVIWNTLCFFFFFSASTIFTLSLSLFLDTSLSCLCIHSLFNNTLVLIYLEKCRRRKHLDWERRVQLFQSKGV